MTNLFDVTIRLNGLIAKKISWFNPELEGQYAQIWDKYLEQDIRKLLSNIEGDYEKGTCQWENNSFTYTMLKESNSGYDESEDNEQTLFLKQDDLLVPLMESALNLSGEGIQIYDENARLLYMNNVSKRISQVPDSMQIQGKHLMDLYDLDENISTTMTALKTGDQVIDRVDNFFTSNGTKLSTANSGFPVQRNGRVIGAVTFEQTEEGVAKQIERLQKTEEALKRFKDTDVGNFHITGYSFDDILGSSESMQETINLAKRIAKQNSSILLVGETGTGKEMFAQSIHKASSRSKAHFLAINCAAVPADLIEGLLFGTVKGGFTGSENRRGYFEEANGGTLFLDELNSMSLTMQSKILRVIQEGKLRRVGGTEDIDVDVRIISSCNEDPFKVISENRLRKDLFYRLSTVMIDLPPLRNHLEDLDELISKHIERSSFVFVNQIEKISDEVMELFRSYEWPGNVRELYHVIDYAMNVTEKDEITINDLPKYILSSKAQANDGGNKEIKSDVTESMEYCWESSLQVSLDTYEEKILRTALEHFGGNITQTAKALDIKRQSLQYRIRKYGIVV